MSRSRTYNVNPIAPTANTAHTNQTTASPGDPSRHIGERCLHPRFCRQAPQTGTNLRREPVYTHRRLFTRKKAVSQSRRGSHLLWKRAFRAMREAWKHTATQPKTSEYDFTQLRQLSPASAMRPTSSPTPFCQTTCWLRCTLSVTRNLLPMPSNPLAVSYCKLTIGFRIAVNQTVIQRESLHVLPLYFSVESPGAGQKTRAILGPEILPRSSRGADLHRTVYPSRTIRCRDWFNCRHRCGSAACQLDSDSRLPPPRWSLPPFLSRAFPPIMDSARQPSFRCATGFNERFGGFI